MTTVDPGAVSEDADVPVVAVSGRLAQRRLEQLEVGRELEGSRSCSASSAKHRGLGGAAPAPCGCSVFHPWVLAD